MVYVYSKQSELNKYIGAKLSVEEIKNTLTDLGMDIKGESDEKDPELKIEITAEKLDMISTIGIARTIKYYRGLEKEIPQYSLEKSKLKLLVKKSAELSRPKTVAAILKNVPMTQELLDEIIKIQEKIHDSFGRHRKKAAIGIYPLDKIEFPITYGSEKPQDIMFRPLESEVEMTGNEILEKHEKGKKFAHLLNQYKNYPVFRDNSQKVLSMPPIINSYDTGRVTSKHKDLFIECSGYNLNHLDNVLKVLCTTFADFGANIESIDVEYEDGETYCLDLSSSKESFSLKYVENLIGISLNEKELEKLLNKQMYRLVSLQGDKVEVEIPCFRSDIWNDCDIADDIARAYGYNNITPKFPTISTIGEECENTQFKERLSTTLTSLGFIELYTYMLSSTKNQYSNMEIDENKEEFVRIVDSADEGINMMRTHLLPEVLTSLNINRKNKYPQRVFENGFTIQVDEKQDTGARNENKLCVAIADPKANYTQIKEVLDTLLNLNQISFQIKESFEPHYIEGRQAHIIVNNNVIGTIGELHPQILTNFGLIVPVVSFEIVIGDLK